MVYSPLVHCSPIHPGAQVHVLGAEQVPPFIHSSSQIAVINEEHKN